MNRPSITSGDVAANVRAELARHQVPVQRLSEAIGIGRVSLSRRINGRAQFTIDEISSIANYLDVPVSDLLVPATAKAARTVRPASATA